MSTRGGDAVASVKGARGKGRPRVSSREKIVEAGLALAAADPSAAVSVVAIARKLGIAPMAIYNYFPNRDALMQELSAGLLDKMEIRVQTGTAAIEALAIWARGAREHFLCYPELLQILGYDNGYASAAWLSGSRVVFQAMESLGYCGDELARAIRWYWNVVMSAITVEVRERMTPVPVTSDASGRLDGYVKQVVGTLSEALADANFHSSLFEFHLLMAARSLNAVKPDGTG